LKFIIAVGASLFVLYQSGAFAQNPAQTGASVSEEGAEPAVSLLTIQVDKTSLKNGGTVTITGTAPAGKPVFIEVRAEKKVRASFFDSKRDEETGKIPYILYMTYEMPAYYKILVPGTLKDKLTEIEQQEKWKYSEALKSLGADIAYAAPTKISITRYQASILASIIGSRGALLPPMEEKENKKRSMQLVKARFKSPDRLFAPTVQVNPDGSYTAELRLKKGSPPGKYTLVAVVDEKTKSKPLVIENSIHFPNVYLPNGGTSVNLFGPFFLTLAIATFGVIMGAGGGFIMNPLLVSFWPIPHTVVAGTVMPTVLFSQATGIYNYSRIKFISWPLGITLGLAMVAGGFIGPKLTELITLEQFKFVFGWILLVLAALMVWQTTPGYLEKNKKEQAILKEFQRRAKEAAKATKAEA
jgi:hypothetical protein